MEASDKLLFDLAMDARKKMDEARQGVGTHWPPPCSWNDWRSRLPLALAVLIPC